MIDDKIIDEFLENGVVLLKQIIEPHWILELQKGVEYNFINPSKYKCVYEEHNNNLDLDAMAFFFLILFLLLIHAHEINLLF